jgi:hypothetical protein
MSNHTPEPWESQSNSLTIYTLTDSTTNAIAVALCKETAGGSIVEWKEAKANQRRIAAAVNACAGIPTEALENGVVRELRERLDALTPLARYGLACHEKARDWSYPGDIDGAWAQEKAVELGMLEERPNEGDYEDDLYDTALMDRARAILKEEGV